jgi:hypothetical protein
MKSLRFGVLEIWCYVREKGGVRKERRGEEGGGSTGVRMLSRDRGGLGGDLVEEGLIRCKGK